jgi:two-component system response regulator GlrR
MGKNIKAATPAAMQKLMLHDWPGNVRELENTIEYAVAMTNGNTLSDDLILRTKRDGNEWLTLQEARARFEKKYLQNLLEITGGNVSKAANLAGKYRADLYNLMKKHDITPQDFKT